MSLENQQRSNLTIPPPEPAIKSFSLLCRWSVWYYIFHHLKLELLTQFPASNDENHYWLWKIDIIMHNWLLDHELLHLFSVVFYLVWSFIGDVYFRDVISQLNWFQIFFRNVIFRFFPAFRFLAQTYHFFLRISIFFTANHMSRLYAGPSMSRVKGLRLIDVPSTPKVTHLVQPPSWWVDAANWKLSKNYFWN